MPDSRITTKRAVIDTGLFTCSAPRTGERPYRVLLYVGRFSPEKNLERLLRAWARLVHDRTFPPARLALVGYGPLEAGLRATVGRLRLGNAVEFRGPVRQRELPALYPRGRRPGPPKPARGLGVGGGGGNGMRAAGGGPNRCGCARDVVTEATGLTFDPFSEDDLVAALRNLMSRPQAQLESMGRAASSLACQYSPENSAQLVMATIAAVLRDQPPIPVGACEQVAVP